MSSMVEEAEAAAAGPVGEAVPDVGDETDATDEWMDGMAVDDCWYVSGMGGGEAVAE